MIAVTKEDLGYHKLRNPMNWTNDDRALGFLVKIKTFYHPAESKQHPELCLKRFWDELMLRTNPYRDTGVAEWIWIERHCQWDDPEQVGIVVSRDHMNSMPPFIAEKTKRLFIPVLFDTVRFIHYKNLRKLEAASD